MQGCHVHLFLIRLITQHVDAHFGTGGIEDPKYDLFTPQGGESVHPEVNCPGFRDLEFYSAILGLSPAPRCPWMT